MAAEKLIVQANGDHGDQWSQLRDQFEEKRGYTSGRNRKKIPRTTNRDVKQLAEWWHRELLLVIAKYLGRRDFDKASRARWLRAKSTIESDLKNADPAAEYPRNEWFWQEASYRLARYLQSRKAVPSNTSLMIDSVSEAIQESADTVKQIAMDVSDAGERAMSKVKVGLIIAGSVIGAAIVLPPVIRAFRDKNP